MAMRFPVDDEALIDEIYECANPRGMAGAGFFAPAPRRVPSLKSPRFSGENAASLLVIFDSYRVGGYVIRGV